MEQHDSNTLGQRWSPRQTLRATQISQIQDFLKEAQIQKMKVHVVSGGKNWGYGSNLPADLDSRWLLDLSAMKKISHYSPELGSIRIEPGVTFYDLANFLSMNNAQHIAPVIGAGGTTSVIGNALERGFSITSSGQRCENILSLEAVLPNGEIYESLHRSTGLTDLCLSQKTNLGPQIDPLFIQSNFGVVTSMDITLPKRINNPSFFVIRLEEKDFDTACIFAKQILEKWEHKVGPIQMATKARVQANSAEENVDQFDWQMIGGIHAEKDFAKLIHKDLKQTARKMNLKIKILSLQQTKFLRTILPRTFKSLHNNLHNAGIFLQALAGQPQEEFLNLAVDSRFACQNKLTPQSSSPRPPIDQHGLIWFAPMIPLTTSHLQASKKLFANTMLRFQYSNLTNFIFLNSSLVEVTLPLRFRKDSQLEATNADQCWDLLFEEGVRIGIFPYRIPNSKMHICSTTFQSSLAAKIKTLIDPSQILMPFRYEKLKDRTQPTQIPIRSFQ